MQFINVTIYDDSQPEDDKTFTIQLHNPTAASLGVGSAVEVTIAFSDNAFGIFAFQPPAFARTQEGEEAELTVHRSGGALRTVEVHWEANGGSDLKANKGYVTFNASQRVAVLKVPTMRDGLPEMREQFSIRLTKSSLVSTRNMISVVITYNITV